jgi:hypothetical protein
VAGLLCAGGSEEISLAEDHIFHKHYVDGGVNWSEVTGDDMATSTARGTRSKGQAGSQNNWLVIGASSLGTVFEWYDFFLYGLLAAVISAQPDATGRESCIPQDEKEGNHVEGPAPGGVRGVEQPENRLDRVVRRGHGAGGGVVYGAVLRAVLP